MNSISFLKVVPAGISVRIKAVPYHLWGNRQPGGEMRVWMRGRI
jgi:DUF1680 family protein